MKSVSELYEIKNISLQKIKLRKNDYSYKLIFHTNNDFDSNLIFNEIYKEINLKKYDCILIKKYSEVNTTCFLEVIDKNNFSKEYRNFKNINSLLYEILL
ncbi:MAG: hypothetical protein MR601_02620 [Erysipelotrichaceae bacterium]|nr:hypothetical protein [Erysipelotrichaceae bacterium]